jgi:AmmeMemoRadiSam system protein B/AmmeMemoRadiSam system protein A
MVPEVRVRSPAVAGAFYPADETALRNTVERLLLTAVEAGPPPAPAPKAIVVPHAGYVFSGPFAALAYRAIAPRAAEIETVVLVGPAHRVRLDGLAVPEADAFATPLGAVPVDTARRDRVAGLPGVVVDDRPHADEHSLEVQVPFLQSVLGEFTLLPIAVGRATVEDVQRVLDAVWGGPETLVVVTSDLSHYLPDERARALDAATVASIEARDPDLALERACGARALDGLLALARQRDLAVRTLGWGNSSDTAGDRERVVGYASFAVTEPPPDETAPVEAGATAGAGEGAAAAPDLGTTLVGLARTAIADGLARRETPLADPASLPADLAEPRGCFVTLHRLGALRGCVGTVEPDRPLAHDVVRNARRAAFGDPRFPPLTSEEWADVEVSVSVLGPLEPLRAASIDELVAELRPGRDGLVVAGPGGGRATFLPAVWEQLPAPRDFVDRLWQKAGMVPGAWPAGVRTWRYGVDEFVDAAAVEPEAGAADDAGQAREGRAPVSIECSTPSPSVTT